MRIGILSKDDELVGPGESGEIVGEYQFIMSGYHENPAANEEATWAHPDGSRWLRTGDVGRVDKDGYLYLVDRKKDMIVSVGLSSEKWGETPVAIVVARNEIRIDELPRNPNGTVLKRELRDRYAHLNYHK